MRRRGARVRAEISVWVGLTAGILCGVSVFVVALPLAFSSPFPAPKQREWVLQSAPFDIAPKQATFELASFSAAPKQATLDVTESATSEVTGSVPAPVEMRAAITPISFAARWNLTLPADVAPKAVAAQPMRLAALSAPAESLRVPAPVETPRIAPPEEAARIKPDPPPAVAPPKKRDVMEDVDQYLWGVYRRVPIKSDSSGDFTWKDPAAAKRMRMSLQAYVIGGMDADFREQLYHAGRAMDSAGIRWSILSAFRDDYRQSLASGFKASSRNSQHGGSAATGGYGRGRAIDITSADGEAEAVWRWIDRNRARFGLRRPMPGYDPAHIVPGGNWHQLAASLRNSRTRVAEGPQHPTTEATAVKRRRAAM